MAFTKYLIPALAAAGSALAQSGSCPDTSNGVYTIQNQGDASALQNCQDFDGSLEIASQTAGNIQLNGIQSISGNLTCTNATGLTSISSDQLSRIGGYFRLQDITVLSNLQFDSLQEVNVINWEGLPNLQGLNFAKGVQLASGVRIVNTQLNSLAGIELSTVSALEVTNNFYLSEFNVNNLRSVGSYVTVAANSADLDIQLPNLVTAANLTFRNISSLMIPSLANVTGAFGCYSNTFESLVAPNLTLVGNALVLDDNSQLTNISLPQLTTVGGGYQIANNTKLSNIDGFTKLKVVGGALDFSGALTNVSLPALSDVRGGFNIQSTETLDCSAFEADRDKVIKGTYVCSGQLQQAGTQGSTPTSNGSGGKKNAASASDVNMGAMALFGAVAALFML